MLFNSYPFLFAFLPLALCGYQIAAHWGRRAVVLWLAIASLAFYAYWKPIYLILLCASILFNYLAGLLISRRMKAPFTPRILLWTTVGVNLAALCFYKYLFPSLNFVAAAGHSPLRWEGVVLPLGISFFTFTQIAYLIDLEQGSAQQQDFESYLLFVTFFPHLIAGPILHHAEIMPQFQKNRDFHLRLDDLAVGLSWFLLGLLKKVLLADRFAPDADMAFRSTASLHLAPSWAGVLSYSLQLYFDFSGYSDMALGLARMFSITFPLNFSSPYKATSMIDFWQRWHMTLTRYINTYLYNPISVWINRRRIRQGKKVNRKAMATPTGFLSLIALPTVITLFLAGIWHGAGKQFLIFGLLHAFYLCVNHAYRVWRGAHPRATPLSAFQQRAAAVAGVLVTFSAVLVAQTFFRASGVKAALTILAGMVGLHQSTVQSTNIFHPGAMLWIRVLAGFVIVWACPNTQQILGRFLPAIQQTASDLRGSALRMPWMPTAAWGLALGLLFFVVLVKMQDPTTFLYFQF